MLCVCASAERFAATSPVSYFTDFAGATEKSKSSSWEGPLGTSGPPPLPAKSIHQFFTRQAKLDIGTNLLFPINFCCMGTEQLSGHLGNLQRPLSNISFKNPDELLKKKRKRQKHPTHKCGQVPGLFAPSSDNSKYSLLIAAYCPKQTCREVI